MPSLSIAEQPPSWVEVNTPLHPSIVARLTIDESYMGFPFFLMAVLYGDDETVLDGALTGGVVNPEPAEPGSSSMDFNFRDLRILSTGTYYVRLDLYNFSPTRVTLIDQVLTTRISVVNESGHD